jgi:hypothetical protein
MLPIVIPGGMTRASDSAAQELDSREAYSRTSPDWLRAVGKLQVPTIKIREGQRRHHLEDCSATLVSGPDRARADTIITAWHCLEYYGDLSKRITFTLFPDSVDPISSEVYRLADGGGIYADWAILRLLQPIPAARVYPLKIHPTRADNHANITMAGYSTDAGLGRHGQLLTYDPDCMITHQSRNSSESDCRAYRGASGGAVVQVSERGEAWLSGVISQGNGAGISTFVPVAGFRAAINRHLR